ncbi:hypothetical protein AGMMS49942_28360 [Spirochaetia bacterium]|nr:hypothetical protein AGMMS49942_28360 [Spirochaetia bacterium]
MTIEQTIDIPVNREVTIRLVVPETVPCGKRAVILEFPTEAESLHDDDSEFEIKEQLAGGFSPELFGKGEICGDIIGPFYEAWADSDAMKDSN